MSSSVFGTLHGGLIVENIIIASFVQGFLIGGIFSLNVFSSFEIEHSLFTLAGIFFNILGGCGRESNTRSE